MIQPGGAEYVGLFKPIYGMTTSPGRAALPQFAARLLLLLFGGGRRSTEGREQQRGKPCPDIF